MKYIASPYSGGANVELMEERFDAVCRFAGTLMQAGEVVYSPIAHCHPIAVRIDLPRTWDFWQKFDTEMIRRCDEVVVLMLDGWDKSKGIAAELEIAKQLGKPISYVEP